MGTCVIFGGSENIPPSPWESRETVDTCVQRPGVVAGLQCGGWAGEHRFTRTSKESARKGFCSLRWLLEPLTGLALQVTGTRPLDQPAKEPFGSDLSPTACQHTGGRDASHAVSVLFWQGCKPHRENLQPEFSSSHWACLASDCPLLERCIFPSSVGRKFPESQGAVPLQSPTHCHHLKRDP